MSQIQQLVYASRATFSPSDNGGGIEPEVARILMQSRRNNPRRGLVGALYYGDGCFFQCLEGPQAALDELFGQLQQDPRHREVLVLRRQPIAATSFASWSMKYVPAAADVQALLGAHGKDRFDPYGFNEELTDAMVGLLQRRHSEPAAPSADADDDGRIVAEAGWGAGAWLALALALLAVGVAAAAFWLLR